MSGGDIGLTPAGGGGSEPCPVKKDALGQSVWIAGDGSCRVTRRTAETLVDLRLDLSGGPVEPATGIGFLDHMLHQLAFHAGLGLRLSCSGDLAVDDHHSTEDCALALGTALNTLLLEDQERMLRRQRFGYAYAPMDESLARVVVDLSGRPCAVVELGTRREMLGGLACENVAHFLRSLAMAAKLSLHATVLYGDNDHHRVEAVFKALALALRGALALRQPDVGQALKQNAETVIPDREIGGSSLTAAAGPASTKGVL